MIVEQHLHTTAPRLAIITSTWPRHDRDISGRFLLDLVSALPLPCEIVCPDDDAHGPRAFHSPPLHRFANGGLFYGHGALGNLARGVIAPMTVARSMISMVRTALSVSARCEIIFSHWAVPGGLVGALCRRIRCRPHVLLLHSADVFWLEQHRCGRILATFIADHCDVLCGVSESVVSRFAVLSGRRGRVLGCGVTLEPTSVAVPSDPGTPTVGSLCRLVAGKGVRRLLAVSASIPGEFRIAGDGPLADEITTLCATRTSAHHDGPLLGPAKRRWLEHLDVFAAPTTGTPWGQPEGLPVSVLEAQAAGLPVVAFAGALPEGLLRDGHNGRLVRPGDWQSFADTLAELLADAAQRRALGRRAREGASAHEIGSVAAQWTALFRELASRGRGAQHPECGA